MSTIVNEHVNEDFLDYTEENPNFDPNNPLALDLKKWKKLFEERLSNPANQDLIF